MKMVQMKALRQVALLGMATMAPCATAQVRLVPVQFFSPSNTGSFLGVQVVEIDAQRAKALNLKEERGVEITRVEDDSPASNAGLKVGDVVLEYNGQRVEGTQQFIRLVGETPPGRSVKLLISRNGVNQTLPATVGTRKSFIRGAEDQFRFSLPRFEIPEVPDVPKVFMSWRTSALGIEAEALEAQLAQYFGVTEGVLVRSVMRNSAAEKAGLKAGDVIVKIDEVKVATPREISSALRTARSKKTFTASIVREKKDSTVTITLEDEQSEKKEEKPAGRSVRMREMKL